MHGATSRVSFDKSCRNYLYAGGLYEEVQSGCLDSAVAIFQSRPIWWLCLAWKRDERRGRAFPAEYVPALVTYFKFPYNRMTARQQPAIHSVA
jgi:hypothetical protein